MTSQQALEGFFDAFENEKLIDATNASTIAIENGRENPNLSLDECSFEFIKCPTMMTTGDFFRAQHDEKLRHQYFDEVISVVENKLGCDRVVCLDMQLHENGGPKIDPEKEGVRGMDDLYSLSKPQTSTSSRIADELAVSLAGEEHRYQRYTVLSLWRFIEDEEEQNMGQYRHLALMDERSSVKPDDYITRERVVLQPDRTSSVERYYSLNPRHASSHKWYYFPNMKMDSDSILIKQMDSDWSISSRMCFRMGISDPRYNIAAREHVSRKAAEVRMVCFWEKPESGINSMPTIRDILVSKKSTNESMSGEMMGKSWIDKFLYGDTKVHEWLGKIESISAGFVEGTEKMTFAGLVSRATRCQRGGSIPMPLNLDEDGKPTEGYFGRYTKEYSDEYEEEYRRLYLPKFLEVVDSYPSWPPSSKMWARDQMLKFGHREVDRGIAEITCVIVDDSMGMVGTKSFPVSKKRQIIDFLIRNETYMYAAMAQWAPLAYDVQDPNRATNQPHQGPAQHEREDGAMMPQRAPTQLQERRDDQQTSRSGVAPPQQFPGFQNASRTKKKAAKIKYGRSPAEDEPSDDSAAIRSPQYQVHRSRCLHEEYSQVKDERRRRLHHRRSFTPNDASSESYDEDDAELIMYSERRDVVNSRLTYDRTEQCEAITRSRRRRDSPESPEYNTDSDPSTRNGDEKSLEYSVESRPNHGERYISDDSSPSSYDDGESRSPGRYTHFHSQREDSSRTKNCSTNRCRDDQQQRMMYAYDVDAPYRKQRRRGAARSSWEHSSQPSL